jgi:hypothetical protein
MDRLEQQSARQITDTLAECAAQGIPATADVRPAVRARLAARECEAPQKARRTPRLGAWQAFGAGLLAVALLALGLLATVPPVQAAFNARLQQRFGLVLIDPQAPPAPAAAQPVGSVPPSGLGRVDRVSVAEAQRVVAFPLRLPAWLPDGLQIEGASVSPSARSVSIFLHNPRSPFFLQLQAVRGPAGGGYGVDAARVQQVQVNGRPAAYAKGGWRGPGAWDETINRAYLSWEADGMTYVLHDSGLGLDRQTLIRIAESLR